MSSPNEKALQRCLLEAVAALAPRAGRREAAQRLAARLGGEDLLIFVADPELGTLLPAPGLPQTLPAGARWQAFVKTCGSVATSAELPTPPSGAVRRVTGLGSPNTAVLAVLGGRPDPDTLRDVATLLPLIRAALRGEQAEAVAQGQATTARQAASEAAALAVSLDAARRDVQAALGEVQTALRIRDDFLALASHELRTPLTSLSLQVQMLLRALRRAGSAETADRRLLDLVSGVEQQIQRLTRLTGDLLDVSRIAAGRLDLRPEETNLGALTEEVVRRFADQAGAQGVAIGVRLTPGVIGAWDRSRLDQVITNLVSNALKYGEGKPVDVTVTANREVGCVSVRDHGIGIAPDDLQRIFERFERASTGYEASGLGLGLYISRQIVALHGGRIWAESVLGEGATFTVELPRAVPIPMEDAAAGQVRPAPVAEPSATL